MRRNRTNAFTLIELLVVIAIIAILAAILFPVFAQAKVAAKKAAAISNMKQMLTAHKIYQADYDDYFMPRFRGGYGPRGAGADPTDGMSWDKIIQPYTKNYAILYSGADNRPNYPTPYGQMRRSYDVARNVFKGVQIRNGWRGLNSTVGWKTSISETMVPLPSDTVAIGEQRQVLLTGTDPWGQDNWVLPGGIENTRRDDMPPGDRRAPFGNISNRYALASVWGFVDGHAKSIRANGSAGDGTLHGSLFPGYEQKAGAWVGGNGVPFWDQGISCLDSLPRVGEADCKLPGE